MTPEERLDRLEQIIEKQNDGIKDLVRVGRIITDAQQAATAQMTRLAEETHRGITRLTEDISQLREAQKETDERLNILIDTVDRIIRVLGRNGKLPGEGTSTQ